MWDSIPNTHDWGVNNYETFTEIKPKEHKPFEFVFTHYSDIVMSLMAYILFFLIVFIIKNGRIHRKDTPVEGGQ